MIIPPEVFSTIYLKIMARYSLLRSEISEDNLKPGHESRILSFNYLVLKGLILCLALYGCFDLGRKAWMSWDRGSSCSCGQSPAEAIIRGCKFDPYAAAWLPDHCRDDDQIQEFWQMEMLANSSWSFYDHTSKKQLTVEEVSMMAGVVKDHHKSEALVTTTTNWHHMHCLYVLLKAFRSKHTGIIMEPRYTEDHHATHCVKSVYGWISAQPAARVVDSESEVDIYA
ncbi:hypothetical protein F5884DRAFT_769789 [Xylogone sp. PMI_703]|nr:hypothetical protein F5884DRAFT_769789 [Xylogone sp. PMI_703]